MLKSWRLDQETSEKKLFIKARQQSWQKGLLLRFKVEAQQSLAQVVSIETYKIKTSRSDFRPMMKYLYRVSFLTTLNIYKTYFKGRHACKKCPNSLFSLKKLLHLYAKDFVTNELHDLHCWWTEELYSQQPLQVTRVIHVLGSMHH